MSVKMLRIALFAAALLGFVSAGGRREFGEDCSITQQILNVVRGDSNDDPSGCQSEKSLLCLSGKCGCAPGYAFEKKGFFSWLPWSRGECFVAANLPCTKDESCISNAQCRSYTCQCEDGYRSRGGHCTNGSMRIALNPLYFIGLVLSYFVLNH